mmetsp:Transcript_81001/g.208506  ORF Transcript_81001/g.208506 Transcript_81001/m.208506 type:complete len:610 (-) Transcript_81001:361-2190(-)
MPMPSAASMDPAANGANAVNCDVQVEATANKSQGFVKLDSAGELAEPEMPVNKSELELEIETQWSPPRKQLYAVMRNRHFDSLMGFVILFNVVLMMVETDRRAAVYPEEYNGTITKLLNQILLVIYIIEASCRMFTDRRRYFWSKWNVLDFCIVCSGIFDEVLILLSLGNIFPNIKILPMLRILRIARLMRAIRLLKFFPELYVMIRGFFGAMKAMFWGLVLLMILVVVWSLVCVEVIHPINYEMFKAMRETDPGSVNEYCAEAYGSIWNATVLYFQTLVAGDSWGACTLGIIDNSPWTFVLFALSLVSVSLGLMNLILAVIVDHASAAREGDKDEQAKEKQKAEAAALQAWLDVIKKIDADQSGTISMKELMAGYNMPEVRQTLNLIGIDRDDLKDMFSLMDEDGSGDLNYDEIIEAFSKAQGQDLRIYLMMTKLQTDSVAKMTRRIVRDLDAAEAQRVANAANAASLAPPPAPLAVPLVYKPHAVEAAAAAASTVSIEAEFQRMNKRIEAQFRALAESIAVNTATVEKHSLMLEAAVSPSDSAVLGEGSAQKAASKNSAGSAGKAVTSRTSRPGGDTQGEPPTSVALPRTPNIQGQECTREVNATHV